MHVAGTIASGLSNNAGARFYLLGASTNNNWMIANQQNGGFLEITPSTAVGGSAFTTPAVVITNNGNVGIGTTSPQAKLDVNSTNIRIESSKTPSSSSDTCKKGEISWDSDYIYVCVADNTWERASLSSW